MENGNEPCSSVFPLCLATTYLYQTSEGTTDFLEWLVNEYLTTKACFPAVAEADLLLSSILKSPNLVWKVWFLKLAVGLVSTFLLVGLDE